MTNELGAFLRTRRSDATLKPDRESLRSRRVPGLRREEVATTAGISVDYYTRLEQGREANPSDSVIDALARVLGLNSDAVQYVYRLRDGTNDPAPDSTSAEVMTRMQTLVEAVRPNPAYVLDRLSTVVAANPEGLALFDGIGDQAPEHRNTCRYLVTHPRAREIFLDWEDIARSAVGHLRAANADDLNEAELKEFVSELSAESDLFRQWWGGHVVHRRRSSVKRILTSDGREISRRYEILHLPDERMRMTLWLPVD